MIQINPEAVKEAISKGNTLKEIRNMFGIKRSDTFKRICKQRNIDISELFNNRSSGCGSYIPFSEYSKNPNAESTLLKKKLIKEGIKDNCCEKCKNLIWMGEELSLELHHIDGNPKNHRLENLEILCPNCHSITNNYRYKNAVLKKIKIPIENYKNAIESSYNMRETCEKLGIRQGGGNYYTIKKLISENGWIFKPKVQNQINLKSDLFIEVPKLPKSPKPPKLKLPKIKKERETKRPSKEILEKLFENYSSRDISKQLNVSFNSVNKWARYYGIKRYPKWYWQKRRLGYSHEKSLVANQRELNPRRTMSKQDILMAMKELENGKSLRKASKAVGFSRKTVTENISKLIRERQEARGTISTPSITEGAIELAVHPDTPIS